MYLIHEQNSYSFDVRVKDARQSNVNTEINELRNRFCDLLFQVTYCNIKRDKPFVGKAVSSTNYVEKASRVLSSLFILSHLSYIILRGLEIPNHHLIG